MTGTICTASRPECLTGGSEYPSTCPKVCCTQSHHMTPKSFVFFQSWTCISHILWLLVYCPWLLFISTSMVACLLPWALIYLIFYGCLSIALGSYLSHLLCLLVYCPGFFFISYSMVACLLPWALIYLIFYGCLSIALGSYLSHIQ